mmetsp:Transcript_59840/g.117615  ORF Transcript_59840/g.117615 Transcript_59840/m.117615 type:complete len:204 (-) Transcript_59840:223-834(-)
MPPPSGEASFPLGSLSLPSRASPLSFALFPSSAMSAPFLCFSMIQLPLHVPLQFDFSLQYAVSMLSQLSPQQHFPSACEACRSWAAPRRGASSPFARPPFLSSSSPSSALSPAFALSPSFVVSSRFSCSPSCSGDSSDSADDWLTSSTQARIWPLHACSQFPLALHHAFGSVSHWPHPDQQHRCGGPLLASSKLIAAPSVLNM